MASPLVVSKALLVAAWLVWSACLPLTVTAGSLRVGPTRLELSVRRPVVVLEVQNTSDAAMLAQLDAFAWQQSGAGDLLEATADVIATPTVMNLAPGETRIVRVGLRNANVAGLERSYRLFVREVPPMEDVAAGAPLRFAVRIGVPVFAVPADWQAADAGEFDWRWIPDIQGCAGVQVFNPSRRHERVLGAEMSSATGEVLWRSSEPVYVLARSRRLVPPLLCAPSIKEVRVLRLTLESGTLTLPVEAPALVVDAH